MLLRVLLIVQIVAVFGERESLLLDLVDGVVQEGNSGNATLTTCEKELLRLHDGLEKKASWAVKGKFVRCPREDDLISLIPVSAGRLWRGIR